MQCQEKRAAKTNWRGQTAIQPQRGITERMSGGGDAGHGGRCGGAALGSRYAEAGMGREGMGWAGNGYARGEKRRVQTRRLTEDEGGGGGADNNNKAGATEKGRAAERKWNIIWAEGSGRDARRGEASIKQLG